jgi:putative endonuclease
MLHFIEVKCRRSLVFGYPEESVTTAKIKNLIDASEEFLYLHSNFKKIQFDVLSINLNGTEATFFLIEDVYL